MRWGWLRPRVQWGVARGRGGARGATTVHDDGYYSHTLLYRYTTCLTPILHLLLGVCMFFINFVLIVLHNFRCKHTLSTLIPSSRYWKCTLQTRTLLCIQAPWLDATPCCRRWATCGSLCTCLLSIWTHLLSGIRTWQLCPSATTRPCTSHRSTYTQSGIPQSWVWTLIRSKTKIVALIVLWIKVKLNWRTIFGCSYLFFMLTVLHWYTYVSWYIWMLRPQSLLWNSSVTSGGSTLTSTASCTRCLRPRTGHSRDTLPTMPTGLLRHIVCIAIMKEHDTNILILIPWMSSVLCYF